MEEHVESLEMLQVACMHEEDQLFEIVAIEKHKVEIPILEYIGCHGRRWRWKRSCAPFGVDGGVWRGVQIKLNGWTWRDTRSYTKPNGWTQRKLKSHFCNVQGGSFWDPHGGN